MSTRPAVRKVHAYLTLPHFVPVLIVVATTGALARLIAGSELTSRELFRLMLAMLGAQLVIGVTNELIDAGTDALTKPEKPIPAGLVSTRSAKVMAGSGLVLVLVSGATFGVGSLLLLLLGTGIGVAYSVWFKPTRLAWLPYLVALPLLPIWVAVSLGNFEPALLLLYPLGAFAVLGLQVAQALPDVEADRAAGIDSLTTRLGDARSILVTWASVLGSVLVAVIVAGVRGEWARPLWLIAGVASALVILDMVLYWWGRRIGIMAAFPCAAASTAMLGLGWVAVLYR